MKTWREKYFEDYVAEKEYCKNGKGYKIVYTYVGDWYSWSGEKTALKIRKRKYFIFAVIGLALFLIGGLSRAYVNTCAVVAIPCVVSLASLMYEWIGLVRFLLTKERIKKADCLSIYGTLDTCTALTALFHIIAGMACLFLIVRGKAEMRSAAVCASLFISGWLNIHWHRYHQKLKYQKLPESYIQVDEMPFE